MWGQATANVLNICPPLRPGCNYCRPSTLKGSYSKGRVDVARLVTRVVINSPWAFEPWLLSGCVSGDLSSSYDGSHFRNVMNRTQQLSTRHPPPRRLRHLFPRAIQSTIERVEASNGKGTPDGKGKGKRRRLIMMRHAESEERPIDARDHDRPITDLGKRTAQEIAKELQDKGWLPELIVCSNATRTRQTLSAMCEVVSALKTARTQFRGSLYSVAALDGHTRHHLQELISEAASDAVQTIMALGHNKGWEEAASAMSGTEVRLETSNAALLEVNSQSWDDALSEETRWQLVDVLVPEIPLP
eukprot:jgi/Botrbrau1/9109/Bobra.0305s0014.1